MAQSSSNLTIGVGLDTSKLQTDLRVLKTQMKELGKELDAAVKSGNAAEINRTSAAYQNLARQSAALTNQLKSQTRATESADQSFKEFLHSGHGLGRVIGEFKNLSRGIETASGILGTLTGGFTGGLLGVGISRGFDALLGQLDEFSKRLSAIKEQAANLGIKPIAVQAIGEIAARVGEEAAVAIAATQKMSDALDEARKRINQPGGTQGIEVLRGGMEKLGNEIQIVGDKAVQVFRQGSATGAIQNFATSLDSIVRRFSGTEEGKLQQTIAAWRQFLAIIKAMDTQAANIFSKERFGQPAETMRTIAEAEIKRMEANLQELRTAQRGATEEALENNKKLIISQAEVDRAWQETGAAIANAIRPARIEFNRFQTEVITGLPQALGEMVDFRVLHEAARLFRVVGSEWSSITESMTSAWSTMWTSIGDATTSAIDWIVAQFTRLKNAISAATSILSTPFPGAAAAVPAMPLGVSPGTMASGGLVRGAGSGTSDSILARLSDGEFVIRAAAVRQLGVGVLQGLNGLAAGGFIGTPEPRFAGGGLVTAGAASGGRPVHLHLGSSSFPLSGSESVVDALVSEAHRQQVRSAGVKPSWFAARPGG